MQVRAKSEKNDLKPTNFLKHNFHFEMEGVFAISLGGSMNGELMGWLGFLPLFPHMIRWVSMLIWLVPKLINLIMWKT
jgi:hypothetical protein